MEHVVPAASLTPDQALFAAVEGIEQRLDAYADSIDVLTLLEEARAARGLAAEGLARVTELEQARDEVLKARGEVETLRAAANDARDAVRHGHDELGQDREAWRREVASTREGWMRQVEAARTSLDDSLRAIRELLDGQAARQRSWGERAAQLEGMVEAHLRLTSQLHETSGQRLREAEGLVARVNESREAVEASRRAASEADARAAAQASEAERARAGAEAHTRVATNAADAARDALAEFEAQRQAALASIDEKVGVAATAVEASRHARGAAEAMLRQLEDARTTWEQTLSNWRREADDERHRDEVRRRQAEEADAMLDAARGELRAQLQAAQGDFAVRQQVVLQHVHDVEASRGFAVQAARAAENARDGLETRLREAEGLLEEFRAELDTFRHAREATVLGMASQVAAAEGAVGRVAEALSAVEAHRGAMDRRRSEWEATRTAWQGEVAVARQELAALREAVEGSAREARDASLEASAQLPLVREGRERLEAMAAEARAALAEVRTARHDLEGLRAQVQAEQALQGRARQPLKLAAMAAAAAVVTIGALFVVQNLQHRFSADRLTGWASYQLERAYATRDSGDRLLRARLAIAYSVEALEHAPTRSRPHIILAKTYGDFFDDNSLALRELTLAQALADSRGDKAEAREAESLRARYPFRKAEAQPNHAPPDGPTARSIAERIRVAGMKEFAEGQNAFNSPIPDDVVRHYDNARLAFGMAVALDPTYAEARYNLAVALRETQHPRAALDQLWRAHADDGGDAAKLCQDIKKLEKYLQAQGFQPVVTAPSQVTP